MKNLQLTPPPATRVIRGITVDTQQQPDPDPSDALARLCGTIDDQHRPGSYALADGRHYHPPFDALALHAAHRVFHDISDAEAARRVEAEVRHHLGQLLSHGLTWQLWCVQVSGTVDGVPYGRASLTGVQPENLEQVTRQLEREAVAEARLLSEVI